MSRRIAIGLLLLLFSPRLGAQSVTGRVRLKDGAPPPPDTIVTCDCRGWSARSIVPAGEVEFAIELVRTEETYGEEAERASPVLSLCVVQATAPGFRSRQKMVGMVSGTLDTGLLELRPLGDDGRRAVSRTTLRAPDTARKAHDQAMKAVLRGKWKRAETLLERAVRLYPEFAIGWDKLGRVYEADGRYEAARSAFNTALRLDDRYFPPSLGLARLDARAGKWQAVIDVTEPVVKESSADFPVAAFFHAAALLRLNRPEEAELSARRALELGVDRDYPQVRHILGDALARQGRINEAIDILTDYLLVAPASPDVDEVIATLAELEKRSDDPTAP